MSKYIKVKDAIEVAINGCASWDGGYFPSMDDPIKGEFASIEDKCIEIVRCGECRWWSKDEPDDEYGYCYNGKILGGTKENWHCADGKRRSDGKQ